MANRPVHIATIRSRTKGKFEIGCDLTAAELRSIGLVSVQWAQLEHSLLVQTLRLAKQLGEPVGKDASNLSFTRRLQELRRLASSPLLPVDESKRLIKLSDRIANLEGQRHKILHALWTWDTEQPEKLTAVSFRPGTGFKIAVNVERIEKLARDIGELMFDIEFPDGPDFENIYPSRPRFTSHDV